MSFNPSVQLRDILSEYFSLEELHILCFDLGIRYEDLYGESRVARSQALIEYIERNHQSLDELKQEVVKKRPMVASLLNQTIPFVVTAMTNDEAEKLKAGAVFRNPPEVDGYPIPMRLGEEEKFLAFRQELVNRNLDHLLSNYGESRDEWKPFNQNRTIKDIVKEISELRSLIPEFYSDIVFAHDAQQKRNRRQNAIDLRRIGCVLVVDAISIFHPKIKYLLSETKLMSAVDKSIAVLLVSPFDSSTHILHKKISDEFQDHFYEAFQRFDVELDPLCDFGISGNTNLKRWLFATLPVANNVFKKRRPDNNRLAIFIEQQGKAERGIGPKFISMSGDEP